MHHWIIKLVVVTTILTALTGCLGDNQVTDAGKQGDVQVEPAPAVSVSAAPTVTPSAAATAASKPPASPVAASPKPAVQPIETEAGAKAAIESRAKETIQALKQKDMKKLEELIHPDKGVRFSPYAYIEEKKDIRLKRGELSASWKEATNQTWGSYDGSGEPIVLSLQAYFNKFVYNQDYAAAPEVGYNRTIGKGTTVNNVFDLYPKNQFITVEYHFKGFNPEFEGNDWASLRLVYEKLNDQWFLVNVIHDQHTM